MNIENEIKNILTAYKKTILALSVNNLSIEYIENILVKVAAKKSDKLKNIASINIVNAKRVIITPWDKKLILKIQEAIYSSSINFSIILKEKALEIKVPSVTEERRIIIAKKIKEYKEKSKISIRLVRSKAVNLIKKENKLKKLSNDKFYQKIKVLNKYIEKNIEIIEKIAGEKIKRIIKI